MMFRKSLIVVAGLVSSFFTLGQAQDGLNDVMVGMEGIMRAGKDPELMAQLFRDMQDPELMAEAQKMMADPEFQKEMKKLQGSKDFKESIKKTKEMLEDPHTAAQQEAKMAHMLKVGEDKLKKGATGAMEEAFNAMDNPEVLAEMTKMMKDPNFAKQLEAMASDPSFKAYIDAMQDMMKDPSKKKKLQQATENIKASL